MAATQNAQAYEWVMATMYPVTTGELQERPGIGAGIRRHRTHLALLEQVALIVQRRDVAEVDACDGQGSAPVECGERGQHQITHGGEQDGRVEFDGRRIGGPLRRGGAQ